VLLLGVTYKPNIADQRESPTKPLAGQLMALGADVAYHDPFVASWDVGGRTLSTVTDLAAELASCDIAVLLQNHSSYDLDMFAAKAGRILDTRGVMDAPGVDRL
jgi:UDP-N-acetyl-D-mannosaminuronate dehydrogenase